jgi:hypothetical protein
MELNIYNKSGNLILTASPNTSSSLTEEIGGECSVSASFTHTSFILLDVDTYIELEGVRYKVKSRYRPKQKDTQTYEYSVKFYAPIHDAEDTLMLFQEGGTTSEFSYDGGPREHLQLWIDNMNRRAGGNLWSIGTVITADNKTIDYRNVKCWDAAFGSNGIAATFETEMWADGYAINLCKAERGEIVELGYLQGLTNLAQEDNGEVKFFTRLFPLGSTKNIDASKYGYSRLQLPSRAMYVDKNVDLYGVKEETEEAAFSEIYPQYVGTVSSVRTEEKTNEEGREYTVYYFKDDGMNWNPKDYEIPDLDYMLQFQTGELAGRGTEGSFQAAWHEDTREWEIINVYPNDTTQIPGDVIIPKPGDTYIPWNFSMPQEYVTAAEQAYELAVNNFLSSYSFDPNKYTGTTDRNYIERNATPLRIGWNVRLLSEQYFSTTGGYKDTRITKVQRKLNDLCQASITCTDKIGTTWKSSVENKLDSLQYVMTKQEQQAIIDIIKTTDSKTPSDYNVLSALKAIGMFLRKDKPDSTNYLIKFLGGLISDNIESQDFASGPFGTGYVLKRDGKTGKSYMEIDELYVRLKAYFDTLEIKHLTHVGGRFVGSPAGMKCNRVEILSGESETLFDKSGSQLFDSNNDPLTSMVAGGEQVYRCYFNNTDEEREIVNEFAIDDLAQCREFNVKEGTSHNVSNQYYWRRVVGLGENYIDLSMTDCDSGSMEPKAGDEIVTIGNKTNPARQHVFYLSAYDEDAPCFKLYSGINSYSMLNKEISVISPNADKNVFTGQVVIKPGSVGFGNLSDAPDMGLIESEINNAKNDAANAQEAASNAKEDVNDLKGYVDGAFADGIITEAEAKAIATYINTVESTSQAAAKSYSELYNNGYLEGSAKVSLGNAYASFVSYKDTLLNAIETAIADGKTTTAEKASVDSAFSRYNTAYASLSTAIETANKSIQDKLKGYSDNAQMAADEAKNNAAQAMEDANEAKNAVSDLNDYVDGAFADGIISETEAKAISTYINTVTATKKEVDATYTTLYSNVYLTGTAKSSLYSAKNSFNTATSNLITAIQSAIADGKTTSSEKSNVDSKFTAFNTAYANLATAIGNANKSIQDKIKEEAIAESKSDLDAQIGEVSKADKGEIAKNMGYADYEEMQYYAERAQTVIKGGHINTELIEASLLITSQIIANAIKTNTLNVNNKFLIYSDGSVDMSGIFHSLGKKTELVISNGYVRIMYNGNDVAKLSVNENTGMPELSMYYENRGVVITAEKILMKTGSGQGTLELDASLIGSGRIKKKSDGTLYVTSGEYEMITVGISASPSYGGTTIPSPSSLHIVSKGQMETVQAIPADGYEFDRWSDGGSQTHTVTWSTAGQSLIAYFTKKSENKYTLSLSSSPSSGGSTSGQGSYTAGSKAYVTATANSGYRFVRWSDGGSQSHYVTMDSNKSLTAYFEAYSVTGDEIFTGTALTSSSFWKTGGSSTVSVSGGIATLKFTGSADNSDDVYFNEGYLGGKLEQGHQYLLIIEIKSSVSNTTIVGDICDRTISSGSYSSATYDGALFYGYALNDGVIDTSYKTLQAKFTADRDTTVNDKLWLIAVEKCTLSIRKISLKEI